MTNLKEQFQLEDGKGFPGKTYVNELLKPVFEDQKEYLLDAMLLIHEAHTIMLSEQKILSESEKEQILGAITEVKTFDPSSLSYSEQFEDLFFLVEFKLGELIGDELAGKMHIAKSRNDLGEGMYRIIIRQYIQELINEMNQLREAVLYQANQYVDAVMPAHTHTQPAQPTTFGHYLVAIYDNLSRDITRLQQAYKTVNQSPMGAAAITTSGFPINRERMVELLGFDGIVENSYDAIATGDYLIESAQALISAMTNMGRWLQEFLRMCSKEVGLIKVSDAYVQISSIMPQKRNPVSIEHSRAIASSAASEGLAIIHIIHNTPYGDINDTEDDLQPHLYKGYEKAVRVVKIMKAVILTMDFDRDHAYQEAKKNMITITELADVLARDYKIPFRKAHKAASMVSQFATKQGLELFELDVERVNNLLEDIKLEEADWQSIIDPRIFVQRRNVTGGTNPNVVKGMILKRQSHSMHL